MSKRDTFFKWLMCAAALSLLAFAQSCSSTKHVPKDKTLLDKVKINVEDGKGIVKPSELSGYLRQNENHKVLGGLKLQLALYNISGRDSSNWFNKWIRRVGAPPVIYDSTLTTASANQLKMALINRGYMKSDVSYDVKTDSAARKTRVTYNLRLNEPYYVSSISYNIHNDTLRQAILSDSADFPIKVNSIFDHNKLDKERILITENLRDRGYYAFNKENITFTADTAAGSRAVDLTLNTLPPAKNERMPYYERHKPFYVRNLTFVTNYDPVVMQNGNYFAVDTVTYHNFTVFYGK